MTKPSMTSAAAAIEKDQWSAALSPARHSAEAAFAVTPPITNRAPDADTPASSCTVTMIKPSAAPASARTWPCVRYAARRNPATSLPPPRLDAKTAPESYDASHAPAAAHARRSGHAPRTVSRSATPARSDVNSARGAERPAKYRQDFRPDHSAGRAVARTRPHFDLATSAARASDFTIMASARGAPASDSSSGYSPERTGACAPTSS